jgi:hypothetical protein
VADTLGKLLADVEELGSAGDIVEIEETDFDEELHSKDTSKATPAKGAIVLNGKLVSRNTRCPDA